mmetsp:Transcript_52534/g.67356  ORF Transcript_52534/g.67356 Transcript_52534/m.67356 type:complete len:251 (-) Transcript_52534:103-855(-)
MISLKRRCFSNVSQNNWFNLENLQKQAEKISVSRSTTLLPCLPSTSLLHREKMFKERQALVMNKEDEAKAERASRRAAVLVPFCLKEGKPAVLFTVRSQFVSTHKGHVSFPGGHQDEGEAAPAAAIRETIEELGNNIGPISLIARCTAIPAVTGTIVQPIIGFLEKDIGKEPHSHFHLSDQEVDRVFALTIDDLYNPNLRIENKLHPRKGKSGKWPIFQGDPHGAEVWGLTAFILDGILRKLITPIKPNS